MEWWNGIVERWNLRSQALLNLMIAIITSYMARAGMCLAEHQCLEGLLNATLSTRTLY